MDSTRYFWEFQAREARPAIFGGFLRKSREVLNVDASSMSKLTVKKVCSLNKTGVQENIFRLKLVVKCIKVKKVSLKP